MCVCVCKKIENVIGKNKNINYMMFTQKKSRIKKTKRQREIKSERKKERDKQRKREREKEERSEIERKRQK